MQTVRRRALRPRPLTQSAEKLLQVAAAGTPGFPRELIAAAGLSDRLAYPALALLLEQGFIARNVHGHVNATAAGLQRAGRRAA